MASMAPYPSQSRASRNPSLLMAPPLPMNPAMLRPGDQAPAFEGRDQTGRRVSLEDLTSRGPVVLYFYPKDFTRVCTQEACLFRDAYEELRGLGCEIVGVSVDGVDTHSRFAARHGLPFSLLSDRSRTIASAYGVKRLFGLFTKRVTFVIDQHGRIRGVFHFEMSAAKHLAEVRALLTTLAA